MEAHIGQHISQATEMQTLCWSKTRPSFSGAHNSYISWSINTIFIPRIGMYTNFIYLNNWCNSVIFCQRGICFWLTLYIQFCKTFLAEFIYKSLKDVVDVIKYFHSAWALSEIIISMSESALIMFYPASGRDSSMYTSLRYWFPSDTSVSIHILTPWKIIYHNAHIHILTPWKIIYHNAHIHILTPWK